MKKKQANSFSNKSNLTPEAQVQVLNSLPVGVILFTLTNIVFINDAARKIIQPTKKLENEITNYSIFDFLLPQYHKRIKDNYKKILKGEEFIPYHIKFNNLKGQIIDIDVKSCPVNFNGKLVMQTVFTNVSERIKIEEQLLESENNLSLILNGIDEVVYYLDLRGEKKIKFVSENIVDTLGITVDDYKKKYVLTEKKILKNIHPDDLKAVVGISEKLRKTKKPQVFTYRCKNSKTGQYIWLQERIIPQLDKKGKHIGNLGISRDITKEREADSLRKEAEEKFKLIAENANDIIYFFTYHPKPAYIYVSPSVKKILGYSTNDFYKNPFLGSSLITDKEGYQQLEKHSSKQQKDGTLERSTAVFQYKTKSGKLIWLEDIYSPIYDSNGKIKCILGISRDITKEKIYQLELEQKWNNYQNLIDSSPLGVFIHDQGICLYCNKTARDILEEKDKAKLIGQNLIQFIVPEQREQCIARIQRAEKGEELPNLIYQLRTSKNKQIDVELKTVPFIYNGKPCVQTIISNLSFDKKLAKETIRAEVAEVLNKELIEEIKHRKKIEKELVTQTTKYEAIFNNTSHLVWTINKDFQVTSFNNNYYKYIKNIFDHDLKIGDHVNSINPKSDAYLGKDFWVNKYKDVFILKKDNKAEYFEIKNYDNLGNPHYREIFLHPIRDNKGEVEEIAVIGHDVTERKKSEQKIIEQAATLNAIFNSGDQLIWTVNRDYILTSFNENFATAMYGLYGIKPNLDKKEAYNPQKGAATEHTHQWWLNKYDEVFNTQKSIKFTVEQIDMKGNKYFRQIFINPIINDDTVNVDEISCISYDITELKYLQSESLRLEQKLSSIFESTSHLIWTVNRNLFLTSYNKNFANVFEGKYHQKLILNAKPSELLSDATKQDYINYWEPLYEKAFRGEKLKFERRETDPKGQVSYREIYLNPIQNERNEIIEVACLAHDITESKNFEHRIVNQSAKLKAIFESGTQLMWTLDRDLRLTSFNQNYANAIHDLYDFYPEENKSIRELSGEKTKPFESLWDEKYAAAFNGYPVEFTSERQLLNGNKVFRQYYLYPIKNNKNEVEEVSGLGFDITENKLNEGKIIQSLKEKEILLKEVHHRVKNNMQVISSILNLQSSYVKDAYALNLLKECQNRVKSMAFIHESLYQTKNFESVNFSEYVTTLTKNLIHTYSVNTQKIKLILTLDKLFLNLDTSIPCGLIINEIISNSLKYAFPGNRDGIIFVNLKVTRNKVKIEAGDNGVGISAEIDIKQTQTLGLQLVDTLIEQINGSLELDRTKGTKFIIDFKI